MAAVGVLKRIYHNSQDPGCFGGINRLLLQAKHLKVPSVNRQDIVEYLRGEQADTLLTPVRRHYKRNHIYVGGINARMAGLPGRHARTCASERWYALPTHGNRCVLKIRLSRASLNQGRACRNSCFSQWAQWRRDAPPAPPSN